MDTTKPSLDPRFALATTRTAPSGLALLRETTRVVRIRTGLRAGDTIINGTGQITISG